MCKEVITVALTNECAGLLQFRASLFSFRALFSVILSFPSFCALCFVIPSSLFCHSEHTFSVIPSAARNPLQYGCFASLSMTRPAVPSTLFFIPRTPFRHSELSFLSFRAYFFCHSERSEESNTWMLRLAQHDKTSRAQHSFFHSAHSVSSFRAYFFVIPSVSEESSAWMLRLAQHDKGCCRSKRL